MINSIENFDLRKWQENALEIWLKKMNGVVSVVTGGGKTFFAILCIIEFFKKFPDGSIVVIVPTIALQSQWRTELIKTLKIEESKISCFPNKKSIPNKINIIIINTARKIFKPPFEKKDLFLIVDECHRSGSQKNSQALNFNTIAELGLSATPKRQNDDGFTNYIKPKLGSIIYDYSYKDAYNDNVISDFDLINIRTNLTENEKEEYELFSRRIAIELSKKKINQKNLDKLMIQRARVSKNSINRIPIAIWLLNQEISKKTIIFTESIEQSNYIFKKLNSSGRSVGLYHTGISKKRRQFNLIEFKKGNYRSLVTCTAVDEGLNVPDIEIAIIVSQTMSIRQRIQRIGRALRKGKEKALIYTIYITDEEKDVLIKEFSNLNDISDIRWKKVPI